MANIIRKRYSAQKPPLGAQLDYSSPFSRGLVFCMLGNENGGKQTNNLCNNIKSSLVNHAYFVNGSIRTDGTDDYISYPKGLHPISEVTIVASIRKVANGAYERLIFENTSVDNTYNYGFQTTNGNNIQYSMRSGGTDHYLNSASTITDLNNFHFLAVTYKNQTNNCKIYIDGKLNIAGDLALGNIDFVTNGTTFDIGKINYKGTAYYANAYYKYVYVFNRILSPAEIQSLRIAPYQMIAARKHIFISDSGGTINQTITPSTLDLMSTLQSLNINYDYVIIPSTLDLTVSLQSPTILTEIIITPNILSLTASILSPTIQFDYLYALAALNLTATLLSPDVNAGTIISISPLSLTANLLSPTITFDQLISLATLNLTAALTTTTIKYDFALDLTALALTAGILVPTVSTTAGRTYLVFDSANNRLQLWVAGTEVARFNQNGSIDVNGVINENAF